MFITKTAYHFERELKELEQRIIKGINFLADLTNNGRLACRRTVLCKDCEKPINKRDLYCIAQAKLQKLEAKYNEFFSN